MVAEFLVLVDLHQTGLSQQVGKILVDVQQVVLPLLESLLQQLPVLLGERSVGDGHDGQGLGQVVNLAANALGANSLKSQVKLAYSSRVRREKVARELVPSITNDSISSDSICSCF